MLPTLLVLGVTIGTVSFDNVFLFIFVCGTFAGSNDALQTKPPFTNTQNSKTITK